MEEMMCPACGKMVMSIKKVENLLRQTTSKILLSQCSCGKTFEIRSLKRNVYEILTSSGKKLEIITNENEGKNENNPLHR